MIFRANARLPFFRQKAGLAYAIEPGVKVTNMAKPPSQNGKSLPKPGRRLATRQVLDMQQAMYKTALLLEKDALECTDREERARVASALANLAKGWDSLENRKRIIRNRGLPKSVEASNAKPKRRAWNGPSYSESPPNF